MKTHLSVRRIFSWNKSTRPVALSIGWRRVCSGATSTARPACLELAHGTRTGRPVGPLSMVSLSERMSPAAIIALRRAAYSQHLLTEAIRRRPSMSHQELHSIEQNYHPPPEGMRRSLLSPVLRDWDLDRLEHLAARMVPLLPVSPASARVSVALSAEVEALLPELRSTFGDITTGSSDIHTAFRQTLAFCLESALVASESDAIQIDGQWFFDSVRYPQSAIP